LNEARAVCTSEGRIHKGGLKGLMGALSPICVAVESMA